MILRELFNNGYNCINRKDYFDDDSSGHHFFKDAQLKNSLATVYVAVNMIVTDAIKKSAERSKGAEDLNSGN